MRARTAQYVMHMLTRNSLVRMGDAAYATGSPGRIRTFHRRVLDYIVAELERITRQDECARGAALERLSWLWGYFEGQRDSRDGEEYNQLDAPIIVLLRKAPNTPVEELLRSAGELRQRYKP